MNTFTSVDYANRKVLKKTPATHLALAIFFIVGGLNVHSFSTRKIGTIKHAQSVIYYFKSQFLPVSSLFRSASTHACLLVTNNTSDEAIANSRTPPCQRFKLYPRILYQVRIYRKHKQTMSILFFK